jgi:hypothetical protein
MRTFFPAQDGYKINKISDEILERKDVEGNDEV